MARRKRFSETLDDKASQLHARFVGGSVACIVLLLMTGIGLNLLGGGWLIVNQIIGIASVVTMIILFSRFQYLLLGLPLVASFNKLFPPKEPKEGEKKGESQGYVDLVGYALLTVSITFMFLGTWSAKENPGAIPKILLSLIVLGLMLWKWGGEVKIGKWFAHVYAFGVLIISMISIFPGAKWVQYTGHDPRILFVIVAEDEEILGFDEADNKRASEENAQRIRALRKIREEGGKITKEDDLEFLERMRKGRDARTLPAMTKSLVSSAYAGSQKAICTEPDGRGGCLEYGVR